VISSLILHGVTGIESLHHQLSLQNMAVILVLFPAKVIIGMRRRLGQISFSRGVEKWGGKWNLEIC
jgi:hypothetical protein